MVEIFVLIVVIVIASVGVLLAKRDGKGEADRIAEEFEIIEEE